MGGSGGGSNGVTDTSYTTSTHHQWLSNRDNSNLSPQNDITAVMDEALSRWGNPFEERTPTYGGIYYQDIQQALFDADLDISQFALVPYLAPHVTAHGNILNDQLDIDALPRFEAGMRDINAVHTSAFTIGRGNIIAMRNRDVSVFAAEIRTRSHMQRNELHLQAKQMRIESSRIMLVADREWKEAYINLRHAEARWRLEVFQYGANLLSAAHGGTAPIQPAGPTRTQSAIGGAMSGAAIGTQINAGWGTAIGAVVGGIAGYVSGSNN